MLSFFNGVDHFLVYTTPAPYYALLLILDGNVAHTRNLEIFERARENTFTILCFPPHSTHRLQPVDVSLMYPLSTYYVAALEKGTNNCPGHVVKTFEISCICDEACLEAASLVTAIKFCAVVAFYLTGTFSVKPMFLLLKLQIKLINLRSFYKKQQIQQKE